MEVITFQKTIKVVSKKTSNRERQVANKLVKQSEQNDNLREKTVSDKFWKLFTKK